MLNKWKKTQLMNVSDHGFRGRGLLVMAAAEAAGDLLSAALLFLSSSLSSVPLSQQSQWELSLLL